MAGAVPEAATEQSHPRQREVFKVFGREIHADGTTRARTLANFPMQANGAEMLRLACWLATERGILVCTPVHEPLLVEGPADEISDVL